MMLRGVRILREDGADGKSGGSGSSGTGAGELAIIELRALKEKYDQLVATHNDVVKNYNKLEADHGKMSKQFEAVNGDLTRYKATEVRKERLMKALDSEGVKGRLNVDQEKALRYLSRGDFDESRVDDEVKEAIELFGEPVSPKASSLSSRGAGSETVDRDTKGGADSDFIGSFALRSLGG